MNEGKSDASSLKTSLKKALRVLNSLYLALENTVNEKETIHRNGVSFLRSMDFQSVLWLGKYARAGSPYDHKWRSIDRRDEVAGYLTTFPNVRPQ